VVRVGDVDDDSGECQGCIGMMKVCYDDKVWELTLLPRMDDDKVWELTLLPRMDDDKVWELMLLPRMDDDDDNELQS
jgi:hypothetical protein